MSPRVKGPWFPSFENARAGTRTRTSWVPGLQGKRQQLRNLRSRCRHILDSKDPAIILLGQRVITSVLNEPDPEYSSLHLICAAIDASEDTGESWAVCITYFLDKFEAMREPPDEETVKSIRGYSRLSGLLRAVVARTFRSRNEGSPTKG